MTVLTLMKILVDLFRYLMKALELTRKQSVSE